MPERRNESSAAYASRFQAEALDLLRKASVARCVYAPEQACPEEWPDEPNQWCGSCLAREILRVG